MVPLINFQKKHHLSFHWKNHSKILRNGNFKRIWITNSSYPLLGLPHDWENNVKKSCFVRFSTFGPKIRHRMLQNAILRLETERTHPKWSYSNRVCPKTTSLLLNRDFLAEFIFFDFQLPFPAENEKENSHFWNLKFWKKCKILTFQKSCLESFWWCFRANPVRLG